MVWTWLLLAWALGAMQIDPASRADVRLRYGPDQLEVEVVDDGRAAAVATPGPGGLGLIGMRERAALHGGQLSAGPRAGGGYLVRVKLPTRAGAP